MILPYVLALLGFMNLMPFWVSLESYLALLGFTGILSRPFGFHWNLIRPFRVSLESYPSLSSFTWILSGPFGCYWNLIRPFRVSLESYPALSGFTGILSGPFGFHWNLIRPFRVSLDSYPALRGKSLRTPDLKCRSKELTSFYWRSVYVTCMLTSYHLGQLDNRHWHTYKVQILKQNVY